jgi:hypothetical protein
VNGGGNIVIWSYDWTIGPISSQEEEEEEEDKEDLRPEKLGLLAVLSNFFFFIRL